MKRLSEIFHEFLKQTGGLEEITLGESVEIVVTAEHRDWLLGQLRDNARFNRTFVIVLIILHITVLVGSIVFCWYWRENASYVVAAFGGAGVGVSIILNGLRKLWREKVIAETVFVMISTLPPKPAVEAIQSIFYSLRKRKSRLIDI